LVSAGLPVKAAPNAVELEMPDVLEPLVHSNGIALPATGSHVAISRLLHDWASSWA
jgi:hypothetical protein